MVAGLGLTLFLARVPLREPASRALPVPVPGGAAAEGISPGR
jgi:hypothetical protein